MGRNPWRRRLRQFYRSGRPSGPRLRCEGFLARSTCGGGRYLVIVECLSGDRAAVLSRVERSDAAFRSMRPA
jgi:hypothetical protein